MTPLTEIWIVRWEADQGGDVWRGCRCMTTAEEAEKTRAIVAKHEHVKTIDVGHFLRMEAAPPAAA